MGKETLVKRIVSGVVFLVIVVGCLLHPFALLALTAFLAVALSYEFYRLTVPRGYRKEEILVMAALVVTPFLFYVLPVRWLWLGLLPVVAAAICQLFDGAKEHAFVTEPYFPLVYILPMLLCLLRLSLVQEAFTWRLTLGLFAILWSCDIGAYCIGMLFGQRPSSRKLFPALSPKKSWIGVVGGTVFAFLAAWAVWALWGSEVLLLRHWLALALITSVFGVLGDLFESLIKRHAGVKDAGQLIPGHGGLLDRFDDALFVFPVATVYLITLQLIG